MTRVPKADPSKCPSEGTCIATSCGDIGYRNHPSLGAKLTENSDCPVERRAQIWCAVGFVERVLLLVVSLFWLPSASADPLLLETENGEQWAGYGRTHDQAHYSPLQDINASNVSQLALAWWFDIPGVVQATSVPLEVDGRLYFATGYSVIRAVDATSGRLLWTYDPEVTRVAGHKLRLMWGIRGIAFWNDKVYTGTHDGRLIAINARTGEPLWSVLTTESHDLRLITGPPLVFAGKVIIGHTGEFGPPMRRSYVTAYDAETGKQLWRFFTVPGDPRKGFESEAMKIAAQTWTGEWWKYGGGGAVWNAMTYDPDLNRVYLGTSNGMPFNQKIRSPRGGDNWFVASIVALDADTGAYLWHYQTNPGDVWDFDATEDMELASVVIDGKLRRVLMQASKNGYFYVIDRDSGKLISAEKFAKVTWADRIDLRTGRPVEAANARYQSGETTVWPGGIGAHAWQPMAFNPANGLVYIPMLDLPGQYSDKGIDPQTWKPNVRSALNPGVAVNWLTEQTDNTLLKTGISALLAWDPIRQRAAWRVALPGVWNGGIATTGGNLVFQGRCDGKFMAYAADIGKVLWSFDAQAGIVGAPITYKVADRQYVSVMVGFGGSGSALDPQLWDARTQPRRLLAFALGGTTQLPAAPLRRGIVAVEDSTFKPNRQAEEKGAKDYGEHCLVCHGIGAVAGGAAPDLRASPVILSAEAFGGVVQRGAQVPVGMPRFEEFSAAEVENIRQYLRSRAMAMETNKPSSSGRP
jgi:quinohemoprotein ethanol dehydrogenase